MRMHCAGALLIVAFASGCQGGLFSSGSRVPDEVTAYAQRHHVTVEDAREMMRLEEESRAEVDRAARRGQAEEAP